MKVLYSKYHMDESKDADATVRDYDFFLGVVGEETTMTYEDGTNMCIGDVVEISVSDEIVLGHECVVKDVDGVFVMGLKTIGSNIVNGSPINSYGALSSDEILKISKQKSYKDIKVNDVYGNTVVLLEEGD